MLAWNEWHALAPYGCGVMILACGSIVLNYSGFIIYSFRLAGRNEYMMNKKKKSTAANKQRWTNIPIFSVTQLMPLASAQHLKQQRRRAIGELWVVDIGVQLFD